MWTFWKCTNIQLKMLKTKSAKMLDQSAMPLKKSFVCVAHTARKNDASLIKHILV